MQENNTRKLKIVRYKCDSKYLSIIDDDWILMVFDPSYLKDVQELIDFVYSVEGQQLKELFMSNDLEVQTLAYAIYKTVCPMCKFDKGIIKCIFIWS